MISVIVEFSNITAATSQNYAKIICFTALAGITSYNADVIPELSKLVGKEIGVEIFKVEDDGSDLLTSSVLVSWNDINFVINVTVTGGEKIIIWYY